eukprot:6183827-Pleurochrysis_carterae.AAC.1
MARAQTRPPYYSNVCGKGLCKARVVGATSRGGVTICWGVSSSVARVARTRPIIREATVSDTAHYIQGVGIRHRPLRPKGGHVRPGVNHSTTASGYRARPSSIGREANFVRLSLRQLHWWGRTRTKRGRGAVRASCAFEVAPGASGARQTVAAMRVAVNGQVHMQCECKTGNCSCKPKVVPRSYGFTIYTSR